MARARSTIARVLLTIFVAVEPCVKIEAVIFLFVRVKLASMLPRSDFVCFPSSFWCFLTAGAQEFAARSGAPMRGAPNCCDQFKASKCSKFAHVWHFLLCVFPPNPLITSFISIGAVWYAQISFFFVYRERPSLTKWLRNEDGIASIVASMNWEKLYPWHWQNRYLDFGKYIYR